MLYNGVMILYYKDVLWEITWCLMRAYIHPIRKGNAVLALILSRVLFSVISYNISYNISYIISILILISLISLGILLLISLPVYALKYF